MPGTPVTAEDLAGHGVDDPVELVESGGLDQLLIQLYAVVAVFIFTAVATFILLKIVDATVGLRVSEEEEREGLDVTQHGERIA